MSERLPTCTARQVLAAFQKARWYIHRSSGSHHTLKHPDQPDKRIVVAMHSRDIPRPIIMRILQQAGLTTDEFRELL